MSIRPIQLVPASWPRCCPFCFELDDGGVTQQGLWEHLAVVHDAATEIAAALAANWFKEAQR